METAGGRHMVSTPGLHTHTYPYIHMDHTYNKEVIWGSLIIVANYPENTQIYSRNRAKSRIGELNKIHKSSNLAVFYGSKRYFLCSNRQGPKPRKVENAIKKSHCSWAPECKGRVLFPDCPVVWTSVVPQDLFHPQLERPGSPQSCQRQRKELDRHSTELSCVCGASPLGGVECTLKVKLL